MSSTEILYNPDNWHAHGYSGANAFHGKDGATKLREAHDILERIDALLGSSPDEPITTIPTVSQPKPVQHIVVLPEHGISIPMTPAPRTKQYSELERGQRAKRILHKSSGQTVASRVSSHDYDAHFSLAHTPMSPADTIELSKRLQDERTARGNEIISELYVSKNLQPATIPAAGEDYRDETDTYKTNKLVKTIGSFIRKLTTRQTKAQRLGFNG